MRACLGIFVYILGADVEKKVRKMDIFSFVGSFVASCENVVFSLAALIKREDCTTNQQINVFYGFCEESCYISGGLRPFDLTKSLERVANASI